MTELSMIVLRFGLRLQKTQVCNLGQTAALNRIYVWQLTLSSQETEQTGSLRLDYVESL
jgi:hypothetical protein